MENSWGGGVQMENTTNWSSYLSMQMTRDNWNNWSNTAKSNADTNKFKRLSLPRGELTHPKG
jgi:hypothetical protein